MSVKYQMQRFALGKGKWWFRIVHREPLTVDELAQRIEDASSLTVADVLSSVDALTLWIEKVLAQGESVQIERLGTFSLSARGTVDNYDTHLTPEQLNVVFRPDPALRRYVREHADCEREIPQERAPRPLEFTDVASERRDAYTSGSIGRLYGSVLKFDPDDPTQGVFFVSEDGSEIRAAVYSHVTRKQVHFLIPAALTGPQRLVVRAQPRFAPEIREGDLSEVLEAV